jgi:hypothetical protein
MRFIPFIPIAIGVLSLAGCGGVGVSYYASTPPPPLRVETFGPAPGPDFLWVSGHWGWNNGAYMWTPGRWEHRPRAHAVWVIPRWERRSGRYEFHPGYWK